MKKSELKAWLESLDNVGDDDSIDEPLSQTDIAKAIQSGALTLDNFKAKMNEGDFKSFVDSLKDTHFNTALETWKKNNLPKIINEEIKKANPDETPEQKMIRELNEKFENSEKARVREALRNKALKVASDKNLSSELIDFFIGQDEESTLGNLEKFSSTYQADVTKGIEAALKNGYKPPSGTNPLPVDESKMSDEEWWASRTQQK